MVLVIDILIASLDANVLTMITHDSVMDHNIMWNWSWNHWTSPPALSPWSRTVTAWWTGHWLQPAASCRPAAVRGEPEFKFSSGPSSDSWAGPACTVCTLVQCVSAGSGRDCTTVRGLGAGTSDQSGYSDRVESTQSVLLPSVITEWESCPGLCTPTCTSPSVLRANVRAPSACTETGSENILRKTYIVTEDRPSGETQVNNPAKHISNSISERRFPNS